MKSKIFALAAFAVIITLIVAAVWLQRSRGQSHALVGEPGVNLMGVGDKNALLKEEASKLSTRIPNGSLITSIAFRKKYLTAAPDEDCIVLTFSNYVNGEEWVKAMALYTNAGKVYVRTSNGGKQLLEIETKELSQGNLDKLRGVCKRYFETEQATVDKSAPVDLGAICAILTWVDRDKSEVGGYIDANEFGTETGKLIAFDWNKGHYIYDPKLGTKRIYGPKDSVTGEPYICARGGDLLECVVWAHDYKRLFPSGKVKLVTNIADCTKPAQMVKAVAVVYEKDNKQWLFNPRCGHVSITDQESADLSDPIKLNDALGAIVERVSKAKQTPGIPSELLGDSVTMAAYRAYARLQSVYNEGDIVDRKLTAKLGEFYPKPSANTDNMVLFQWERQIFAYYPEHRGSRFIKLFPAEPANKNRVIEGVRIVEQRRREHPSEQAVMIPYILKGHKLKASILWTDQNKLMVYNHDTDTAISIAATRDAPALDADNFRTLGLLADAAIQKIKKANVSAIFKRGEEKPDAPYDTNRFTVDYIASELKSVGVVAEVTNVTKERYPDGSLREYKLPSLKFKWGGNTYTYGPDFACYNTDGFVIRD